MTDFEKIKQFFVEHQGRFVGYNVIDSNTIKGKSYLSQYLCDNVLRNPNVKDFFALEFPFDSQTGLVDIDSLDSFVFDFYFVDYGNTVVIDDAGRTFECGVDSYEGNGVIATQIDATRKYLAKNGLICTENYAIVKQTSLDTFVQDTITFVKALQTLNNAQPYPPYILELDNAKEVVDVLTRCWVAGERLTDGKSTKKVALFNNYKEMQQGSCPASSYPPFYNKLKFIGLFFNSDSQILIRKKAKCNRQPYHFAIVDHLVAGEDNSLVGLQRAVRDNFGFAFTFGELAPALTTVENKLITDYFLVSHYNVDVADIKGDGKYVYQWATVREVLDLIDSKKFANFPKTLVRFLDYLNTKN